MSFGEIAVIIALAVAGCVIYNLHRFNDSFNDSGNHTDHNSSHERLKGAKGAKSYKTEAFGEGRVYDIVEKYRNPPSKPVNDYPAPYVPPPKPAQESTGHEKSLKIQEPNALIVPVIEKTRKDYQLPPGAVEMPQEETAVIVAIILYFIKAEPKIGITKLESYIIMLDKICLEEKGRRLFSYRLTYGPYGYYIQNFRAFLDFIEEKNLLSKRRKYFARRKYKIDFAAHTEVPEDLFPAELREWLSRILIKWEGAGADHTKHGMMMMLTSDALEAFTEPSSLRS